MSENTFFSIGEHFSEFVEEQVREGRYSSASDVVRAALRLLEEQETKLAALRGALIEGEQSGPSTPFDFEAFIERHPWELASRNNQFAGFPNAIFMTLDENGWHDTFLTPAEALNPPDGIQMTLESNTNENVTFTLTNNNDTDWMYGVHYRIDVLLNDIWYSVPPQPGNWAFVNIGLILEAGQTETLTYGWGMHGDLPPGTYRLVKHSMYVVFDTD